MAMSIYTHNAKRAGYQLVIRQESIAYCKNDHIPISWLRSSQTLFEIVKERMSIKSPHYWKAHLAYYRSFLGVMGIAFYIVDVWLKMFLVIIARKFLLTAKHK